MTSQQLSCKRFSLTLRRSAYIPVSMSAVICFLVILPSSAFTPTFVSGSETSDQISQLVSEVSGSRIMGTIEDMQAFGSRAFYLDSANATATYLLDRFARLGMTVDYDWFLAGTHRVANIVATKLGTSSDRGRILVGAHYDSENRNSENYSLGASLQAPGADDDASGVASVLELARTLSNHSTACTIQFVAFAAEENGYDGSGGLAGSMHFAAKEKANGTEYESTVVLDMIGYRGSSTNHVVAVTDEEDPPMVASMRSAISDYGVNLTLAAVEDRSVTYSDHFSFWQAGYPSILLIESATRVPDYQFNPNYHTANDTVSSLNEDQIAEVTKSVLGGILSLVQPVEKAHPALAIAASGAIIVATAATFLYIRSRRVGRR